MDPLLRKGVRNFNTGSGSRAPSLSSFFSLLFTTFNGNVGAGYGFCAFTKMDTANQNGPFVPSFDGKASSFLDYEQRVALWLRSTDVPAERQSALLILHMDPTARQVRMFNSEEDALMAGCDAQLVMRALRDYFQPETSDRFFFRRWIASCRMSGPSNRLKNS